MEQELRFADVVSRDLEPTAEEYRRMRVPGARSGGGHVFEETEECGSDNSEWGGDKSSDESEGGGDDEAEEEERAGGGSVSLAPVPVVVLVQGLAPPGVSVAGLRMEESADLVIEAKSGIKARDLKDRKITKNFGGDPFEGMICSWQYKPLNKSPIVFWVYFAKDATRTSIPSQHILKRLLPA